MCVASDFPHLPVALLGEVEEVEMQHRLRLAVAALLLRCWTVVFCDPARHLPIPSLHVVRWRHRRVGPELSSRALVAVSIWRIASAPLLCE